jgi:pyrroloquinoline-quinone synthase
MDFERLRAELDGALAGRHLLSHPFYLRWEAGELDTAELRAYAGQYRHFEATLPQVLCRILDQLETPRARDLLQRQLMDETGGAVSHLELFDGFASALGVRATVPPSQAMADLLGVYESQVGVGGAAGLAAVAAYEIQAPGVAKAKLEGLRAHYGLDADDATFWRIHGQLDENHARWITEALAEVTEDLDQVSASARSAAEAWWSFLDEREQQGVLTRG